ncbi:MAG: DeoR/GlpR family DNA-binding transcription regulator [Candidatus Humimicrobiaceae bacterium]
MLRAQRQAEILSLIDQKGFVTNKGLQEIFKVNQMTIRRDLKELSKQKMIMLVHGGAKDIKLESKTTSEPFYKMKSFLNIGKKQSIGRTAVDYINDGNTILLDTGTTTFQIAENLKHKKINNLTVLTNDIKIANELCSLDNIKVFVLGGELRQHLYSLYGFFTVKFLEGLKVDKLFLAADAVNKETCISNANLDDVPIKQEMINCSKFVILVADSTKFNKEAFSKVCNWEKINLVITDNEVPEEYIELFKDKNINYKICDSNKLEKINL